MDSKLNKHFRVNLFLSVCLVKKIISFQKSCRNSCLYKTK